MEFWSTVTFRAGDDDEKTALREVMRAVGEFDPTVAEAVGGDDAVVVKPEHARALAEALQQIAFDGRRDDVRRGLIKALAFNQHYVENRHGWTPIDVIRRHHLD